MGQLSGLKGVPHTALTPTHTLQPNCSPMQPEPSSLGLLLTRSFLLLTSPLCPPTARVQLAPATYCSPHTVVGGIHPALNHVLSHATAAIPCLAMGLNSCPIQPILNLSPHPCGQGPSHTCFCRFQRGWLRFHASSPSGPGEPLLVLQTPALALPAPEVTPGWPGAPPVCVGSSQR